MREIFEVFPLLETLCLPHTLLEGVLKEQIKGRELLYSVILLVVELRLVSDRNHRHAKLEEMRELETLDKY